MKLAEITKGDFKEQLRNPNYQGIINAISNLEIEIQNSLPTKDITKDYKNDTTQQKMNLYKR